MIRVLVKASSPLVRAGLESLIRESSTLSLVDDSPRGPSAASFSLESPADVLVVEAETVADLPARDAIDWAGAGRPVVLLLRNLATDAIADALRAGVKAVLPANLRSTEIVIAIEAAAAGLVVIDSSDLDTLLRAPSSISGSGSGAPVEPLTPRETEVLRLLAAGLGNKEMASRLAISEHTIKFHVASIMGKLGAASRTEAVTLGIRHGLIMI